MTGEKNGANAAPVEPTKSEDHQSTPYIGFGNDQLSKLPKVKGGDEIRCPNCGALHVLKSNGEPPELLLTYACRDAHYLGAIDGRLVVGVRPAVSGRV